ncbi:hypothetical protein GO013_10175 [Pseudodesulfovibrio sp. JC047]|uniref:hypothetical protein n=1 Tax=Pseudodesulfovibrio sp. JC047 TaxID=2683199 RepID=UPI0013D1614B|nr:hypothetical protein [Pseudodesulfovibrio sp. JC047]NDV19786.1 hypothetical protein [Pseudodesulfovibrio sp. JC047]
MALRLVLPILLSVFLLTPSAYAFQGYVQHVGEGGAIAWGSGELSVVQSVEKKDDEVTPYTPLAIRKAVSKARRLLLDMVLSTRINAKRTVSSALANDRLLASQVRGLVHNSLFRGPSHLDTEGSVQVSERFRGKLAELIFPTTIQFQSGIPPKLSTYMEQSETELEAVGSAITGYSGLVIDARGMRLTPALAPNVYGQDGLGVYGAFLVSRANAVNKGVVAYANTSDLTVLRERVGNNPLRVKAVSAYGSWRTDVVIESSMASLVRAVLKAGNIVENCAVVILVDDSVPSEIIETEIQ